MNQLLNRLRENAFTLLVSLPRNDAALAEAALRGGAQGLKVHLNVEHFASGTRFGTFDEERDELARVLAAAKLAGDVPVGVVPGAATPTANPFATPEEFEVLASMGMDFFDAYPADAPPWTLKQRHLGRMLAAYEGASMETMKSMERAGMEMCEASIINHGDYGRALSVLDVERYRELARALNGPVIVPSQKKITPRDLPALRDSGVKGLLIGAIVTGREADSIEAATRSFRAALDADA